MIPPPVEPGDAPIIISTFITIIPALVNSDIGFVAKPAVLVLTLVKKDASQLIPSPSVSLSMSVPRTIKIKVISKTILVCKLNLDAFFLVRISVITKNPSPPNMTRSAVRMFTYTWSVYAYKLSPVPNTSKPALLNDAIE